MFFDAWRIVLRMRTALILRTVYTMAAVTMIAVGGFASHAAAQQTVVSKRDCQHLVHHVPAPDVAYRPGVDVRGRKVAPADLPGSGLSLPREIDIPITIDFAERYGFDGKGVSAEKTLGRVTVRGGQAYWNGAPLGSADQARIAQACRQAGF